MAIDDKDSVLLVVRDDNAIHLLDKSLKFKRLILTVEDGLQLSLGWIFKRKDLRFQQSVSFKIRTKC